MDDGALPENSEESVLEAEGEQSANEESDATYFEPSSTEETSLNVNITLTDDNERLETSIEVEVDLGDDAHLTSVITSSDVQEFWGEDGEAGEGNSDEIPNFGDISTTDDYPTVSLEETENEGAENPDQCVSYYPPIEEIVIDGNDSMFGTVSAFPSRHISRIRLCTKAEALEIANYILGILEEDLFNYYNTLEDDDSTRPSSGRPHLNAPSSLSIDSNFSDPLPGEPSTMKLFSECEPTSVRPRPGGNIEVVDASVSANLHRQGPRKPFKDASTITRDMTFVDELTAELVFRHNYPLKDDYKPPEIPSRKASLDAVMASAVEAEPTVDRARIGPKVRWGKKKRLLQPLPQDYFREETFWTGSVFRGQYIKRQFAHGRFEYPLMSVYESEFKDGHAQTDKHLGCVVYPRGDKFEGEWVKGRHVTGQITFADDLKFEQHKWSYLAPPDRRFYIEKDIGIKQAGKTLFNDRFPPPHIPPGEYDTGYGIFNPDTGVVRGYGGEKLRDASYAECKWIMSACRKVKKLSERYQPSFHESRIPGCSIEKFVKQ